MSRVLFRIETNAPYVMLSIDDTNVQLLIPKAREIAYWILRATSTGEADAFLVGFMDAEIGLPPEQQGNLLQRFRDFQQKNAKEQAKED
jgi:hypothetical protein